MYRAPEKEGAGEIGGWQKWFTDGHDASIVCIGSPRACRASEFELSTFSAIVLLFGDEDRPKEGDEVANLMDTYVKLPVDNAKRAMRFWRIRQRTRGQEAAQ